MPPENCQRACTFALDLISDTIVLVLSLVERRLQIEHANLAFECLTGVQRDNVQSVVLSVIEETDQFLECAMKCIDNRHIVQPLNEFHLKKSPLSYKSRFPHTSSIEDTSCVPAVGKFHPYEDCNTVYCVAILTVMAQDLSLTKRGGGTEERETTLDGKNGAQQKIPGRSCQIRDSENSALDSETTNKLLRKFVESAPFYLSISRIDDLDDPGGGVFIYVNKLDEVATLLRCPKDKIIGQRAIECRDPVPPQEILKFLKYFKESKERGQPVEFERGTPYEHNEYIRYVVQHLGDNYFLSVHYNETSRKHFQDCMQRHKEELEETVKAKTKELQEALEIKSRFLAIVSHEIRTPLTGILGMLTVLAESNLDVSQSNAVQIATTCCDQLMIVITDILDVTKAEYGNLSFEMNSFSMMKVVEESLDIVTVASEKKKLELLYDVDPNLPVSFISDKSRLRQVLVNLLNNAVKFSSKGQIMLTVVGKPLPNDRWELVFSVADEGIGIAEAVKPKLFKPFQQADTSFSRSYGGSGLGLLISKRIVELMGGKIWFESQEGKGSTFYFSIEIIASDKKKPNQTKGLKVLLLEPNPTQARLLQSYLCSLEMIVTSPPAQCFTELKNKFDVVIMDASMTEAMQHYRQCKSDVVVLGQKCPQNEDGMFFVNKPIRYSKLYDCLMSMCSKQPRVQTTRKTEETACLNPNMHILVAEDNPLNQKVILKVLQSIGFHKICIVSDGKQALEKVKQQKFDVILMDCMMPVVDGYSSTKQIRAEIPSNEQPHIIALTANVSEDNRRLCFSAGMNYVLTKPIEKSALLERLNLACLDKRQQNPE